MRTGPGGSCGGPTAPGAVTGAVSGGLLLGGPLPTVWDPVRRRTVRRLPLCGQVLGAAGAQVALRFCPADRIAALHVINVGTGRDRVLRLPAGEYDIPAGTFSPNGRNLVMQTISADGQGRLLLADLDRGTIRAVRTPAPPVDTRQVWTSDSTRFFFTAGTFFTTRTASLWTYALGDPAAAAVRYLRPGAVTPLAVLPPR